MKNTLRSFDVDFSPCDCKGTVHVATRMQVISVRWKRTDKHPHGRVRFQCMRCKTSWSMNNIKGGATTIKLDAGHPEEIKRRKAIHKYYNDVIAVNLSNSDRTGIKNAPR
jgi:hypothetical protein